MARPIPSRRFDELVDVATKIFIANGHRRTQMADVAAGLGLGKGTLYGYVEGKEALFHLAMRYCDSREPIPVPEALPLPNPKPGEVLATFDARVAQAGAMPALVAASQRREVRDVRAELQTILVELYTVLSRNHRGIRLMEACALDHPELQERWNAQGRVAYGAVLAAYLGQRSRTGALHLVAEPPAVARFVIETVTTWAVHIRFDKHPQQFEAGVAEAMVVHFLVAGLVETPAPTGAPS